MHGRKKQAPHVCTCLFTKQTKRRQGKARHKSTHCEAHKDDGITPVRAGWAQLHPHNLTHTKTTKPLSKPAQNCSFHTCEGWMMCGFSSRMSNGSCSSWAKDSRGDRVPDVSRMLHGTARNSWKQPVNSQKQSETDGKQMLQQHTRKQKKMAKDQFENGWKDIKACRYGTGTNAAHQSTRQQQTKRCKSTMCAYTCVCTPTNASTRRRKQTHAHMTNRKAPGRAHIPGMSTACEYKPKAPKQQTEITTEGAHKTKPHLRRLSAESMRKAMPGMKHQ